MLSEPTDNNPVQNQPEPEAPQPLNQNSPLQTNPEAFYPTPARPADPSAPPPEDDGHDGWHSILSTIGLFLLAPLIALSIAAFVIQSYQVDGQSMETTLQDHDRLIVDKAPRTWARLTHHNFVPHRGDIIIFNLSGLPDAGGTGQKQLIKRVIGLPGERVVVKDGKVAVYNEAHPNGFNPDTATGYHIKANYTPGAYDSVVPSNSIFVLGDNRTNSEDSRYFGPVALDNIVGKLMLRLLPLSNIKKF
jgi:signal peptidase I